jgi:predicted nucleotidyltransferase
MRAVRQFARRVADQFDPDAIILFGSHAYGQPNADSDVDILVVMPARNQLDQAAKIRLELPAPFAMDLIVRTPKKIREALADGESFTREVLSKGKILYEKDHRKMGAQSRGRPRNSRANKRKRHAAL